MWYSTGHQHIQTCAECHRARVLKQPRVAYVNFHHLLCGHFWIGELSPVYICQWSYVTGQSAYRCLTFILFYIPSQLMAVIPGEVDCTLTASGFYISNVHLIANMSFNVGYTHMTAFHTSFTNVAVKAVNII